jgi:glycosyltransferase involved in cell wall biosynthesis
VILIHDIQDNATLGALKEIVDSLENSNIALYEGIYGSPGAARNAGLEKVTTPWVTFWDSDDLPNPVLAIRAVTSAVTNVELIIGNYLIRRGTKSQVIRHQAKLTNVALNPGLWRMIFRREVIDNTMFLDLRMGEDQIFTAELNLESRNILFLDDVIYEYWKGSPEQLTSNKNNISENIEALRHLSEKINADESSQSKYTKIIFLRLLITTISNSRIKVSLEIIKSNFKAIQKIQAYYLILVFSKSVLYRVGVR